MPYRLVGFNSEAMKLLALLALLACTAVSHVNPGPVPDRIPENRKPVACVPYACGPGSAVICKDERQFCSEPDPESEMGFDMDPPDTESMGRVCAFELVTPTYPITEACPPEVLRPYDVEGLPEDCYQTMCENFDRSGRSIWCLVAEGTGMDWRRVYPPMACP
jgi:hypothetical protein